MVHTYVQQQHKERAKLLNFAKVTMANLCIRQCFPRQNLKSTDLPKFCVIRYFIVILYYYLQWLIQIGTGRH